jgi:catechol 2,3-dioxygenase-like lactoylglutathione lyase family enzyme
MKAARLTVPILSLTTAALLSACSAGGPATAPATAPPSSGSTSADVIASVPASVPASAPTGVPAGVPAGLGALPGLSSTGGTRGSGALALLPVNFPLPSGATGLYGGDSGGATVVVFAVPDVSAAVAFYRDALPKAGFPLAADSLGFPLGFTGSGITEGVIGVSGNAVGVSIYGTFTAAGEPSPRSGDTATAGGGPATGGTITISQDSTPLTEACGNATVNLEGDSDDVTLTGSCQAINVSGDSDHVVAGSAGRVNLSGDADEVTVNSGSPAVTKTGIDDMVQAG